MFCIRNAQVECLAAPKREKFKAQALTHLMSRYRDDNRLPGNENGVRALIQAGISKALTYGVTSTCDIICLLEWMVEIDPNFEELSHMDWIKALLTDETLSGKAKVDLIAANMS